jgi:TRAP-type C4-dicarboxylate transport system substrate-binding protein
MSITSRTIAGALGLSVAAAAFAAPEHKWTMAIVPVTGSVYYELAQSLPERISKATDGRVELTVNGSLIAPNRVLEAVRDGQVQMSIPILGYYTASQPLLTLTNLPGLAENMHDLDRILDSSYGSAVRDMYAKDYHAKELMTAAFCPQTFFSSKPVNTMEDWKGLRVRVNNAGTAVLANTLGAKPAGPMRTVCIRPRSLRPNGRLA